VTFPVIVSPKNHPLHFFESFSRNVTKNVTLVGYYGTNGGENCGIEGITGMKENKTMSDPNKASTDVALRMKQSLENEGFETTWRRPMLDWVHGRALEEGSPSHDFYIFKLPVERITPFDFSEAHVSVNGHSIYFELTFYYCKVLERLEDGDEINEIYDRHNIKWAPRMADHFLYLTMSFPLEWDTEFDEYIEHSLYGNFPPNRIDLVLDIMRTIREQYS